MAFADAIVDGRARLDGTGAPAIGRLCLRRRAAGDTARIANREVTNGQCRRGRELHGAGVIAGAVHRFFERRVLQRRRRERRRLCAKLCGVEPKRYLLTATCAALANRAAVTLPHTLLA